MAKLYFYGHDLDWKPVKVDWRNPYRTVIKAGTPLNANGETANDSNCVGLVMEDSYPKNEFVRVVVKGETDFAMLEEHSGIVLANEVREKLDVYDNSFNSVSWKDLLDRPFGEEVTDVNITWDGNTKGLTTVRVMNGDSYCKLSDETLSVGDLVGGTISLSTGKTITINEEFLNRIIAAGLVTIDYAALENLVIAYRPCTALGGRFTETGLYFINGERFYTSSLSYQKETIKTLDAKYMPCVISPDGTSYKIIVADDGTLSTKAV